MQAFANSTSAPVILAVADAIVAQRDYLSDIDGKTGDGDHGVNMAKGFSRAAAKIRASDMSFSAAMSALSDILMNDIGGSMGPLYGMMFLNFADSTAVLDRIDAQAFAAMLKSGLEGVQSVGDAKPGDKSLIDSFIPAIEAFNAALDRGQGFGEALPALTQAAEAGRDSTVDMVARVGRGARMGERSRGSIDAGATSCALILATMARAVHERLEEFA